MRMWDQLELTRLLFLELVGTHIFALLPPYWLISLHSQQENFESEFCFSIRQSLVNLRFSCMGFQFLQYNQVGSLCAIEGSALFYVHVYLCTYHTSPNPDLFVIGSYTYVSLSNTPP